MQPFLQKYLLLALAVLCLACQQMSWAQPAEPAAPAVQSDSIAALREQLTASENLPDEQRKQVEELLVQATARREKSEALAAQLARLQQDQQSPDAPAPPAEKPPVLDSQQLAALSASELQAELVAADQRAANARDQVQQLTTEVERRAQRRQQIPELLVKAKESFSNAEQALRAEPVDEPPLVAAARREYQRWHLERWRLGVLALEQEARTYEATARRLTAERDAAIERLQPLEAYRERVAQLAASAQRKEAERKASEAHQAAVKAHPALKEVAARNALLAEANRALVEREAALDTRLSEVRDLVQQVDRRFEEVRQRALEAEGLPVIGTMLRDQQDQLPSIAPLRQQSRGRPEAQAKLRLDKFDWKIEREALLPVEETANQIANQYTTETGDTLSAEVGKELQRLVQDRAEMLATLIANADDAVQKSSELLAAESEAMSKINQLSGFIAERVFWVPSAQRLSLRELGVVGSYVTDVGERSKELTQFAQTLWQDAKRRPEVWGLFALLCLFLIALRQWAKGRIRASGEQAEKPYATSFRPTISAVLGTLIVASPTAMLLGFLGVRLLSQATGVSYAVGQGLVFWSVAYFLLNLMRHACRPGGLADKHFGWDLKVRTSLRRTARWMQLFPMTLLAIVIGGEAMRDEASAQAIGRLSLMLALAALALIGARLLRSGGPLPSALQSSASHPWLAKLMSLAAPVLVALCVGLLVASAAGWHFTATQLTRRLLYTVAVLAGGLALRGLLMRWLLVTYRRVAMQRAREKRQALQDARENAPQENAAIEVESEVKLSDINQQARSLVDTVVVVSLLGAVLLAWGDALPALGVLDQTQLWQSSFTTPEGGAAYVTLADVLLAVGALVVTFFAAQNLPGLLEFSLFEKLPMEPGVRYAASSVTRYMISVVGFLVAMRLLGVSWSSVQWLVAAMTVGLGFGLQEIFANFVSGIILLLERPVRPGDVVTVGDVSGVVSKIRIRATTVQDWDNKELIVPNREFITGNLINWTLTSRMLRLVIKVGVAYGSDTRLVSRLLYEVAESEAEVVDSPAPFVLFDNFGDSTLNFELRVFVSDIAHLLDIKHRLHMAIDDVFRQHGVEIAFPQQDLHVRTLPETFKAMDPSQPLDLG